MSPRIRSWSARLGAACVVTGLALSVVAWASPDDTHSRTTRPSDASRIVPAAAGAPATSVRQAMRRIPRTVFVLGDSLTVGTEPWLGRALAHRGWSLVGVDARVGRAVPEGLAVLERRARHRLPGTVLVALGTNDLGAAPSTVRSWLSRARAIVGHRRLVWVNLCLDPGVDPRLSAFRRIDTALQTYAPRFGVQVADWCTFATRHGITSGPDGIHYSLDGYRRRAAYYATVLADMVRRAPAPGALRARS